MGMQEPGVGSASAPAVQRGDSLGKEEAQQGQFMRDLEC